MHRTHRGQKQHTADNRKEEQRKQTSKLEPHSHPAATYTPAVAAMSTSPQRMASLGLADFSSSATEDENRIDKTRLQSAAMRHGHAATMLLPLSASSIPNKAGESKEPDQHQHGGDSWSPARSTASTVLVTDESMGSVCSSSYSASLSMSTSSSPPSSPAADDDDNHTHRPISGSGIPAVVDGATSSSSLSLSPTPQSSGHVRSLRQLFEHSANKQQQQLPPNNEAEEARADDDDMTPSPKAVQSDEVALPTLAPVTFVHAHAGDDRKATVDDIHSVNNQTSSTPVDDFSPERERLTTPATDGKDTSADHKQQRTHLPPQVVTTAPSKATAVTTSSCSDDRNHSKANESGREQSDEGEQVSTERLHRSLKKMAKQYSKLRKTHTKFVDSTQTHVRSIVQMMEDQQSMHAKELRRYEELVAMQQEELETLRKLQKQRFHQQQNTFLVRRPVDGGSDDEDHNDTDTNNNNNNNNNHDRRRHDGGYDDIVASSHQIRLDGRSQTQKQQHGKRQRQMPGNSVVKVMMIKLEPSHGNQAFETAVDHIMKLRRQQEEEREREGSAEMDSMTRQHMVDELKSQVRQMKEETYETNDAKQAQLEKRVSSIRDQVNRERNRVQELELLLQSIETLKTVPVEDR
mmetsp:Transcript_20060/g.56865  ORF Transcript_20060/g.56865 Transcript_20060/m.56865 type:complete len:634 (+) Transcript_20060:54-1955(+)